MGTGGANTGAAKGGAGHCVGIGEVEDRWGYWVSAEISICEHDTDEMSGCVGAGRLRDDCTEGKQAGYGSHPGRGVPND